MKTLNDSYTILERLLDEEHLFLNSNLNFSDLCSWLGVSEKQMDSLLIDELGLDGRCIMEQLRKSMPERIERKYGIKVPLDAFF